MNHFPRHYLTRPFQPPHETGRLDQKREHVAIYLKVFSLGIVRCVNNCQGRSLNSQISRNRTHGTELARRRKWGGGNRAWPRALVQFSEDLGKRGQVC